MTLAFEYFLGPEHEMAHLLDEPHLCLFCGQLVRCFVQNYQYGCASCLKEGRFTFWHDTEIGLLEDGHLSTFYRHHIPIPPDFSQEAVVLLERTPQFISWQQAHWLVHCNDFMIYLGEWRPKDFSRFASDGNGRALFVQLTQQPEIWDTAIVDGKPEPDSWYISFYGFRCRHCGIYRGYYDLP